tara:strand:+ start:80 stop:298 length:219 start_codon:yes stop_codon:yes gene_type:complete
VSERLDEILTPDVPFLTAEAFELRTDMEVGRVNESDRYFINPPGPSWQCPGVPISYNDKKAAFVSLKEDPGT